MIDGLTRGARRKEIQRRFNADPATDPLRILLATDAAREGLNFQAHCADLFHFDLPWNPGRIEQRNGRIDRKLQPAPEVRCHYFVLPQRVEDRVLEVLVRKTETIKRELGSLSWAATLDTLRPPRKSDQKLANWRRESPIRPVVFEDAGVLSDDTVHLHLEQRVAQRLLARFRAQGFVYHDLSRACLAQAKDSIPRVILLGRLCLYGRRAERLHEEIVPLAARWIEPGQRSGPLKAYAREAETRTLDLLEQSLTGRLDWTPHCWARRRATSRNCCHSSSRGPRSWPRWRRAGCASGESGKRAIWRRPSAGSASASSRSSSATRARTSRSRWSSTRKNAASSSRTCATGGCASSSSTGTWSSRGGFGRSTRYRRNVSSRSVSYTSGRRRIEESPSRAAFSASDVDVVRFR